MNILDKRASNPAAALNGTELVYVAQLGADAVTTVQDMQTFITNGFLLISTAATTYQTLSGMSSYLTTSAAASTYVAKNAPITGATKTKITYNTDGLITSGADATTADIADSPNRRYITDAQQTVLNNTSNTNSGDETTATIKTKLGTASSGGDGYLTSTDWNTFNDGSLKSIFHNTNGGTITLTPGKKLTQIISTVATMTLTGGVAIDQSEIVRIIARVDTTISLSGAIVGFGDGHTGSGIGATYTLYRGETIDLVMPASNSFYVHGQHIQDSNSLAIYKPGTNNKLGFNLTNLSGSKTLTMPNADVDLGTIVTAAQINWGFGFGTTPAGLTLTNASGAISQVNMSSVIVSSENLVNGLVHGARKSARYIVTTGSTFNVDLNTLTFPYYVQFEANHGGGTATLVITLAGIGTFFDAKSATTLGGSPLTIKITPGEVITIRMTDSLTFAIVDRSLDVGIASNNRVSSGYRAVFRAPDDFTANRTITVPNANVDLGKVVGHTNAVTAITVTASPFTYQNAAVYQEDILITGGTVSLVEFTRDNATWYARTGDTVSLSPSDRVRVTYTVAPTMTKIPR